MVFPFLKRLVHEPFYPHREIRMKKTVEWDFPQFDTGSVLDAELTHRAGSILFRLTVDIDGRSEVGSLQFLSPRSYRWRAEVHCTGYHVTDCFLALCRVENSDWAEEIKRQTRDGWKDQWKLEHFIFFVPDFSSFEVLCEGWEVGGFFSQPTQP